MSRGAFSSARDDEEAVFSSSEDRIRASQASLAGSGPSIVLQETSSGPSEVSVERVPGNRTPDRQAWVRRTAESLFSVIFPSDCRLCGEPLLNISRLPVCPNCVAGVVPARGKMCSVCGERVLSSYAETDPDGLRRCPVCRRVDRPFERAVAYGSYEGGLRELIHLLKYNGVRPAAKVLGRMLAEALTALDPEFEQAMLERGLYDQQAILVIPVPLYKSKRRQREFNQAELIAQAALKSYPVRDRLELAADLLQRTRDTHSQIGLTSHQRRENLRGAFAVMRAAEVTGRDVLLVDDVYTTGTTATECARILRRAGARQVWVATVARTLKLASKYAENQGFNVSTSQGFEDPSDHVPHLETLKP
jgi:ComF family protein